MKMKFLLFALCSLLFANAPTAQAATPWWLQPTICKLNPTHCYPAMGAGFDSEMWDATGNCRGLKLICPAATTDKSDTVPKPIGRGELAAGTGISPDFDTDILNGDCFGSRKTIANGSQASVNGKYVRVWCGGILANADETLASGEITLGTQPTCRDIAPDGYVAVLNQKCYGKMYDPADYYIECSGTNELPTRIIATNNADYATGISGGGYDYPTDAASARDLFDTMQTNSAKQKAEYFK
jgi:hypothetical protein